MVEKGEVLTVQAPTTPVKKSSKHPRTAEMVNTAIMVLKERHGSSLQAIKKYITTNYNLDVDKMAPFIKKYIKAAVANGTLVQTKGKGASGSFKLPPRRRKRSLKPKEPEEEPVAKPLVKPLVKKEIKEVQQSKAVKKPASPKKKKPVAKKAVVKVEEKAPEVEKKQKSRSKAKKGTKSPTTKPKTPKPKKIASPKASKKTAKK